jgi:hypothetical protein
MMLKGEDKRKLWSNLEEKFPSNIMLRGLPSYNVDINTTLKYIPPVHHLSDLEKDRGDYVPVHVDQLVIP